MDWKRVKELNRKRSAKKAARERAEASRKAAVEAAGGKFTLAELKAATVRVVELPRRYIAITDPHVVWDIRGGEWMVWFDFGNEACGMMRLADRHQTRDFTVCAFASVAAKTYAAARANEAHNAYATAQPGA